VTSCPKRLPELLKASGVSPPVPRGQCDRCCPRTRPPTPQQQRARPRRAFASPPLQVFQAQGHSLLSPSDRTDLHPLVIPLVKAKAAALPGGGSSAPDAAVTSEDVVIGLLRWPQPRQHGSMQLPLVAQSRKALGVKLLARSVDEQLHR